MRRLLARGQEWHLQSSGGVIGRPPRSEIVGPMDLLGKEVAARSMPSTMNRSSG